MPTAAIATFSARRLDPLRHPELVTVRAVNLKASTTFLAGMVLAELAGNDEIQTVTIAGGATGGTFTITFGGQTTSAIPYASTAAVVQAALEALSSIGAGNIYVTKAADVYTLTFRNALGQQNVAQVTASATGLTGGTPTITPATGTAGAAGTGPAGVYAPYLAGASDGSQLPRGFCQYDCVTDAGGNIVFGAGPAGTSEWGQTRKDAPMLVSGVFKTDDLVGFDANALSLMGRLVQGTVASGEVVI